MSHLMKLGLAVVLALAAATLNWMWLTAEKNPPAYVVTKVAIPEGTEITAAQLTSVPVPGDAKELNRSLIPFGSRAVLFGLKATRSYRAGEVVFQRDIRPPTEPTAWEVVGPFQLISVGERFRRPAADGTEVDLGQGGNNVTIAVPKEFDDSTRRLLEVINPRRGEDSDRDRMRIVAVQVVPSKGAGGELPGADREMVYQTISLDGIENVPRVLLEGDRIRFVIPGEGM